MTFKLVKKDKYGYLVSIKTNGRNYCEYPKKKPEYNRYRGFSRIYFDYSSIKRIDYPPELALSWIEPGDKIEQELIDIQNEWPNWYKIKIVRLRSYNKIN